MLEGGPEGMYELATRFGVDRTAVMSWAGPLSMDSELGNRIVAEAVERHPDHFLGLSTVNPTHDDPEDIEQIIDTYHREKGWPGVKVYAPQIGLRYDDPAFERYFDYANENELYAVIDPRGIPSDDQIENLARSYPDMGIHIDHCGRSWSYAKWAVTMAEQFANVWLQINFTAATNGVVEYLVESVGADRVLWGTDAPMRDPRPQASWLVFTRLSQEQKESIFGGNFAGILQDIGIDLTDE
jgi:predicted TIM-barrel fold metal-dependent hydrolase